MHHAVIFLILTREFVLFDQAILVIGSMGAEHYPVLGASGHGLGIHIVTRFGITHQPAAFFPESEVFNRLVIDRLRMLIGYGVEIDLGLGDMQKALLPRHRLGFGGVQHVVRRCSHLCNQIFWRPDCLKRFYRYHNRYHLTGKIGTVYLLT